MNNLDTKTVLERKYRLGYVEPVQDIKRLKIKIGRNQKFKNLVKQIGNLHKSGIHFETILEAITICEYNSMQEVLKCMDFKKGKQ